MKNLPFYTGIAIIGIIFIIISGFQFIDDSYSYDECVELTLSPGDYKKFISDEIDLSKFSELINECLEGEIIFYEEEATIIVENDTVNVNTTIQSIDTSTSTTLEDKIYPKYSTIAIEAYLELLKNVDESYFTLKWKKDIIKIEILGDPSFLQRDTFNYVIGDLNRIIPNKEFLLTENNGDIVIYFGDYSSWNDAIQGVEPTTTFETATWFQFYTNENNVTNSYGWLHNQFQFKNIDGWETLTNYEIEVCSIYAVRAVVTYSLFPLPDAVLDVDKYGPSMYTPTFCAYRETTAYSLLDEEILGIHFDERLLNLDSTEKMINAVNSFNE